VSASAHVVDVSPENFQTEVVEKSRDKPVLLEFYADAAEPSRQQAPVLRQLAEEYGGKFLLARIDIRANQQIVQQLGVRTLPTIKVIFQGQMVQDLEGMQQPETLRTLLDELTMSPMERVRVELDQLLEAGQRTQAIGMLQQVIAGEPKNNALKAELCDLLIQEGRSDEAKQILAALPPETEGIGKPRNRLEFIDLAADLPSLGELAARLERVPDELETRFNLSIRLVVDDQVEAALEHLLTIMKKDRDWEEQKARITMIKIFDLLGKGNELATRYRRSMFAFLH
jgi:putative thioredoxin